MSRVFSGFCLEKSRLFPGPFLCLVFLENIDRNPNLRSSRLTAGKKWREVLGNRGVHLHVFIRSAHFEFRQSFKMSDVYVKIKMNKKLKRGKIKYSALNKGNLAMKFRLDLKQGIYIHFLRRRRYNSTINTSRMLRRRARGRRQEQISPLILSRKRWTY